MRSNLHKDDANAVVVEQAARLDELTAKLDEIRQIVNSVAPGDMVYLLQDRVQEVLDR